MKPEYPNKWFCNSTGGAKEVVRFAIDLTTGAAATDTYSLTIGDAMFTTTAANSYTTYAAVATALNAMTVGDGGTIADLGWIAAATTGGVTLTATATGAQVDTLLALGASAAGAAAGSADVTTQGSAAANSGGAAAISLIDTALSTVAEVPALSVTVSPSVN